MVISPMKTIPIFFDVSHRNSQEIVGNPDDNRIQHRIGNVGVSPMELCENGVVDQFDHGEK